MAMASSSARRKALTNRGTSSGTIAFARRKRLPDSKSAPRAICAFMILSASSIKVGMKRRAMDIIMAISWAGKRRRVNGRIRLSMPSVREMAEVVSVRSCEAVMSSTSRTARKAARRRPMSVTVMNFQENSGVPSLWKKMLSKKVISTM